MFTGIIVEVGEVASLERRGAGGRLRVRANTVVAGLEVGDSVAVEGACLTAASVGDGYFEADLSPETAATTTLGDLRPGDAVNLELPTPAGSPLGGHFVQGHVDGIGTVRELTTSGDAYAIRVAVPPALARYVVEKGSVAVAGISLTAVDVRDGEFGAALIPHTYENTTLKGRRPGSRVNVEVDVIAKYVERLAVRGDGLTAERLAELGYDD
jgi:riboflavin synthase